MNGIGGIGLSEWSMLKSQVELCVEWVPRNEPLLETVKK